MWPAVGASLGFLSGLGGLSRDVFAEFAVAHRCDGLGPGALDERREVCVGHVGDVLFDGLAPESVDL